MTHKLEGLYEELFSETYNLIRACHPDPLDEYEKKLDSILKQIVEVKDNPWREVSGQLSKLPTILITPEQKEFLQNIGVNIWTNGAQEVFNFNNNMTFIVKTK